jgi:hypothetical protein
MKKKGRNDKREHEKKKEEMVKGNMEKEKGRNDKKKKMKRLRSYHRNCQQ